VRDALYCKHCAKKLTIHDTDRCMECFLKQDDGKIYHEGYWNR